MRLRLALMTLLVAVAVPLGWLSADLPEYDATEISVGDDPVAVTVTPDDRVVATLLGTSSVTLSWLDSADFGGGASTIGLDGESAGSLAAGTLDGSAVVFVGGTQLDVVRFDASTIPATPSVDASTGLGSGRLDALAWDSARRALFAIDNENDTLRHVDLSGTEPAVDALSDDWPLDLPFLALDLVLLDSDTLLVVGDDGDEAAIALVDITSPSAPALSLPDVNAMPVGAPVAAAADEAGMAWLLFDDGELWSATRADATSGDDDDDDSAADDDDSAADDDDSTADDDDSAAEAGLKLVLLEVEATPAAGVLYRTIASAGHLITAGSNTVTVRDLVGAESASFSVSTEVSALAGSSGDDGFVYAGIGGTGQLAVLSAGPWVVVDSVTPVEISDVSQDITVGFTVTFGDQAQETCDYTLEVDSSIAGGGTALTPSGTAAHGESVEVVLSGEELPAGEHDVFVFCADDDGDAGRASFAYASTGLAAPSDFALDADDGSITVTWTDDGIADTYVMYFDSSTFESGDSPEACNADTDNVICSPYTVVPGTSGDDDDSGADRSGSESVQVTGLTNGTRYYFAVAGRGDDGVDGPWTSVLSAIPSARGGAAILAGDTGGCSCNGSFAAGAPVGALFLLAVGPLLRRRRGARS